MVYIDASYSRVEHSLSVEALGSTVQQDPAGDHKLQ